MDKQYEYKKKWRLANKDKVRESNRKYYTKNVSRYRELERIRLGTEAGKKSMSERTKKTRAKYPERYKARWMVRALIRKGSLRRGDCDRCGKPEAQAHHPDYSKPLEIVWLCSQHHADIHREKSLSARGFIG